MTHDDTQLPKLFQPVERSSRRAMTQSGSGPLDGVITAVFLVQAIQEIDQSTEVDREVLLATVLCAAWPTRRSQNQ